MGVDIPKNCPIELTPKRPSQWKIHENSMVSGAMLVFRSGYVLMLGLLKMTFLFLFKILNRTGQIGIFFEKPE